MDYVSMFAELSAWGRKADHLMEEGRLDEAEMYYERILATMEEEKRVDPFLLGKLTLSRIQLLLRRGRLQEAFALWRSDADEDGLNAHGIRFIEGGQLSLHDLGVYLRLCAYFRSQALGHLEKICDDIDTDMEKVWEVECEDGSPDERFFEVLAFWRLCHREACDDDFKSIPETSTQIWTDHMVSLGLEPSEQFDKAIAERPLAAFFPALDDWRLYWVPDGVIEQYAIGADGEIIRDVVELKNGLPVRVLADGAA